MRMTAWSGWGTVLGFALGGFFDGILLHQILQWHHLLSLVPGLDDLRLQILWDGYFHALMYLLAAAGIWGLWRAGRCAPDARGRTLVGAVAIGFGLWHVADAVLSHWILGIHRIRPDSPAPLAWDLLWLAGFGLVPVLLGWLLLCGGGPRVPRRPAGALLLLTAVTGGSAAWSFGGLADQPFTTVVFRPGIPAAEVVAAVASAEARLVWADGAMAVVVVDVAPERRWAFYGHGALLVSGTALPAGCFAWSRV